VATAGGKRRQRTYLRSGVEVFFGREAVPVGGCALDVEHALVRQHERQRRELLEGRVGDGVDDDLSVVPERGGCEVRVVVVGGGGCSGGAGQVELAQ